MTHNPERGCGRKKKDSYYMEGQSSPGGVLSLWTWLLDDGGVNEENILYWQPPPRQSVPFRPLESIAVREIYRLADPALPSDYDNDDFQALLGRVPRYGLVDHVGEDNYSAFSFAKEVVDYGPSRRISPQFAKEVSGILMQHGACPVFFTHNRIPAFRSAGVRDNFWHLAKEIFGLKSELSFEPTWRHRNFGIYASDYDGWKSSMINVLSLVDSLEKHWSTYSHLPLYIEAKEVLSGTIFVERPFGATWITNITYTGEPTEMSESIPGLRYLDLDADEIVGYSMGGEDDDLL